MRPASAPRARLKHEAKGFVGNATGATAGFFGRDAGVGTMPHAIIGYAGSTVRAAEMYHEAYPDDDLTVLVDYYGKEVTDTLAVCRRFPKLAAAGKLAVRLDVMGSRYMEGLDPGESYKVLDRNAPDAIRGYRTEPELRHLIGPGVSAAAIWLMREKCDATARWSFIDTSPDMTSVPSALSNTSMAAPAMCPEA